MKDQDIRNDQEEYEKNRPIILMQSFWKLQKAIMTQVRQTATDNNLSLPQFSILVLMQRNKQMGQKKLLSQTHFPKSTLSHAIDGLVQAELLHRTHVEGNRREMQLMLNQRGEALLNQMNLQEDSVHTRFKSAVDALTE